MVDHAEQEGQRQRIGEDLAPVSCRARASRASRPAKAVPHVYTEGLATNAMFDDARRQEDPITLLRGAMAQNEILGEKLTELLETSHAVNYIPTRCDDRAESKLHSIHHAGHKHTS